MIHSYNIRHWSTATPYWCSSAMKILHRLESRGTTFSKTMLMSTLHFFSASRSLYDLVVSDRLKVRDTGFPSHSFQTCFTVLTWHLLPGNLGQNSGWEKMFITHILLEDSGFFFCGLSIHWVVYIFLMNL